MSSYKKILVTGASGFLGTHLVRALATRGESVRAFFRRKTPPDELVELSERHRGGVELFRGDLGDEERVRESLKGIDAVIHTAALAIDWGPLDLFMKANYEATVNLIQASRETGVENFLYISSAVVHGFGPHVDTNEEGPYYPLKYPYQITKKMTEEYVLGKDEPGFKVTALRPCNVYGPGDRTSTYAMYEAIMKGVFGYVGSGDALTCPLYIDDLCAGTLAALDCSKAAGEIILLTDGMKVSWKDYCRVMFEAVGSGKKPVGLPAPLAMLSSRILEFGSRLIGSTKAPPLTTYRVEQASQNYHFSNAKAEKLLGFKPTIFYEEGLGRTAEAFLRERAKRSF